MDRLPRLSKNLSAGIVKGQGPLIYNRGQGRHARPQVRSYGGFAAVMHSLTAKPPQARLFRQAQKPIRMD